ncbi:DUF982 domain-containing protein [Shinella kummerowiae]|uniref:DUF982 domain-containing protein n=1 Tax=Shinella kummerowiae TaxID=417745 RepID=UPI003B84A8A4
MTGAWGRSITIEVEGASEPCAHLRSTQDAAHYLLDCWKKTQTPSYCAAVRLCAKAIRGEVSHDVAYVAFMAAALEAEFILVSNRMTQVVDDLDLGLTAALAASILAEHALTFQTDHLVGARPSACERFSRAKTFDPRLQRNPRPQR